MRQWALWGGVIVAAALAGCVQKPPAMKGAPVTPEQIQPTDELARRVSTDPLGVLQEGLDRYDRDVTSYTCTLYKQERIDPKGPLGLQQKLLCKFMEKPFSVYLEAVANPVGAKKTLYVQGQWGNRMLVEPAGLGSLLGFMLVEPRSPQARMNTLRFVDQFGFKRNAQDLIRDFKAAQKDGLLKGKLLGNSTVEGRDAIVYDAQIAGSGADRFEFPHARVWLDRQWLLPIAVELWDAQGVQRGIYRYADVNFEAHLTARDFTPQANGMRVPQTATTQSAP